MIEENDDHIDKSQWLGDKEPIITPERAKKGDLFTGPLCEDCRGSGKNHSDHADHQVTCRACRGKGWIGTVNMATLTDKQISDTRFAQMQVRNILNFLWERGIITDLQHDDGCTFEAWRNQHRVALGLQRSVSTETAESTSVKLRAYGFVLIIKKLSVYDHHAIDNSLSIFANHYTETLARRDFPVYQRAFSRLAKILPPIREQIAYLESLSDEEREAMAEGVLKILLASRVKYD